MSSLWMGSYVPLFLDAVRRVLPRLSAQVTENRNATVGASEIGKCARWTVADKLLGKKPEDDPTCLRFLQGHTREETLGIVHRQISQEHGWHFLDQLRVYHPEYPQLRAHIDHVFMDAPAIDDATHLRVLEEKYVGTIPEGPRDSWVYQFQFQMGLLKLNYPDKTVDGGPFVTTHDDLTDYGGAWELNEAVFQRLVQKGRMILDHMNRKTLPAPEPDLLCGWCSHRVGCPAFADHLKAPLSDEALGAIERYKAISREKKELERKQRVLKGEILNYVFGPTGRPKRWRGQLDGDGEFTLDYSIRDGRKTCDLEMLAESYPEAYEATVKPGDPYDVLQVL